MAAGLGFKTFQTGEVLTAADTNGYLMQGILVFANAAARTSAVTSPQEGQYSYLKDTNALEYYDGAAWVGAPVGDITAVTAGTGISGGGSSGAVTITNDMATTITASGDIVVGTGSGTYDNLPIGSTGQVLTADTTVSPYKVKWAAASTGKVVQIVYGSTQTGVGSATATFADTNLSATITPTSASNKVLIFFSQNGCHKYNANTRLQIRLLRGATTILNSESFAGNNDGTGGNAFGSCSAEYLDSPATTSATTYKTQFANQAGAGTVYVNDQTSPGSTSTIILMEVTP